MTQTPSIGTTGLDLGAAPAQRYCAAIAAALEERRAVLATALDRLCHQSSNLAATAKLLVDTLSSGNKILVVGNGGSAAEAQHFATELVGRFRRERDAYAVLALTADTAVLTAVANDYGFRDVFARQVQAHGQRGDVLVAFSTSGESENLIQAAFTAHDRGLATVAVTGEHPSRLAGMADIAVRVPTSETALAQELHVVVLHLLCDIVEAEMCAASWSGVSDR